LGHDVSGFAPPGDIHSDRNAGNGTAISIHVYGTSPGSARALGVTTTSVVPARSAA
jgi:predicted metal-dependent enzyme (double-stranded beta helix superfamily)